MNTDNTGACKHPPAPVTPPCDTTCEAIPKDRPRYFCGRLLTARDLADEQAYFLARLRLHNRLLLGSGVVSGLGVAAHPNPACQDGWIVVEPGIAIDCCGRELFVCEKQSVKLPVPVPKPPGESQKDCPPEPWGPWIVCLRYAELPIEPQPVLLPGEECRPGEAAPSRVRETCVIEVKPRGHLPPGCWPEKCPRKEEDPRQPAGKHEAHSGGCLEAPCPCGDCLPLALLDLDEDGRLRIDTSGTPRSPGVPGAHTRICRINWPHGGEMTLQELIDACGRLEVMFDHPIAGDGRPGTGVGLETFRVSFRQAQLEEELILPEEGPSLEDPCRAVFVIPPRFLQRGRGRYCLLEASVTVTLRCDFILDDCGNPVDGDHLRGMLPSGNGRAGGDFVSWFTIVEGTSSQEQAP